MTAMPKGFEQWAALMVEHALPLVRAGKTVEEAIPLAIEAYYEQINRLAPLFCGNDSNLYQGRTGVVAEFRERFSRLVYDGLRATKAVR